MKPKPTSTAFGWPGIKPRWTHGDKDGVGTAYAASSRICFTLWNGIITEGYYPTVDHSQIRVFQFFLESAVFLEGI
jgi:glucoamylase